MNKVYLSWLIISLILASATASAGDENGNSEECTSGPHLTFENVIVKPHFSRNNAFYLDEPNGVDGQAGESFNWGFSYSPRFEAGYLNEECRLGIRSRYWYFKDTTTLHANDPDGNIAVFFADDSSNDIGFSGATDARFQHRVKLHVFDLEAVLARSNWNFSAGIRYVEMDQRYTGTEANVVSPESFSADHDFDGWGFTTAAELSQPFADEFTVFAKVRGSLLYGDSSFLARNADNDARIKNRNKDDLIPIGEIQIGVDWRRRVWRDYLGYISAAAEGQYWGSAGTGAPGNNAVFDEGNYQGSSPEDADMGFVGFVVGLGLLF